MTPGVAYLPVPPITRAPAGTFTDDREPTAAMRLPRTTIVASGIGAPPLPSITVPPTIAMRLSAGAGAFLANAWPAGGQVAMVRAVRTREERASGIRAASAGA